MSYILADPLLSIKAVDQGSSCDSSKLYFQISTELLQMDKGLGNTLHYSSPKLFVCLPATALCKHHCRALRVCTGSGCCCLEHPELVKEQLRSPVDKTQQLKPKYYPGLTQNDMSCLHGCSAIIPAGRRPTDILESIFIGHQCQYFLQVKTIGFTAHRKPAQICSCCAADLEEFGIHLEYSVIRLLTIAFQQCCGVCIPCVTKSKSNWEKQKGFSYLIVPLSSHAAVVAAVLNWELLLLLMLSHMQLFNFSTGDLRIPIYFSFPLASRGRPVLQLSSWDNSEAGAACRCCCRGTELHREGWAVIFAGLPARVAHLLDPGPAQWHLDGTGFVPSYVGRFLHASPRAVQGWTQLIGTFGFEIAEVRQIDLKGKTVCPSPDWCSRESSPLHLGGDFQLISHRGTKRIGKEKLSS
ncbi:hypothetical protein Anapl_08901 [Anas platyrhynchos]|uniref:Uncharacterized protein n=1 Tax=Anas platyrhynchos TaxID=8839 RepID=R0LVD5_ANAPL|nr:hypothetical protein Anapl_08901 [Anas platyrhynchos]